jgi:hypothetical protein
LPKAIDCFAGNKPETIRPPSKGGNGKRLKTEQTKIPKDPCLSHCYKKLFINTQSNEQTIKRTAQIMAWIKLEPGPARATQTESILGIA